MKDNLKNLLNNAYAPYSGYKVAAIVKMNDGNTFSGVNVENASYGATICAERNAINSAIAAGYTKGDFKEMHLMNDKDTISYPCFICRQTLIEFFKNSDELIIYNNEKEQTIKVEQLTPYPFSKEDLL